MWQIKSSVIVLEAQETKAEERERKANSEGGEASAYVKIFILQS
jgi:hypothetical protein